MTPATTTEGRDVEVGGERRLKFDDGTRMKELAEAGKITIGVKFDQPGSASRAPTDDSPTGFDVEIAKLLVADLGIAADEAVTCEETISDNREPFLQAGEVDLVLASYSITDERRQVVGQAGPYMVTGQQLLVKRTATSRPSRTSRAEEVCSVTGSTSLENIEAEGAEAASASTPTPSASTRSSTAPSTR